MFLTLFHLQRAINEHFSLLSFMYNFFRNTNKAHLYARLCLSFFLRALCAPVMTKISFPFFRMSKEWGKKNEDVAGKQRLKSDITSPKVNKRSQFGQSRKREKCY